MIRQDAIPDGPHDLKIVIDQTDRYGKCHYRAFQGDEVIHHDVGNPFKEYDRRNFCESVCIKQGYLDGEGLASEVAMRTIADKLLAAANKSSTDKAAHREVVPAQPFPVSALPSAIAQYISEASAAIGCDPSFVALPLLACLARAIGNKRVIQLKRTWREPAIVWAAIVGKSGSHKSPALQASTAVLDRKQADAILQFEEAQKTYDQDRALYERDFAAWKRSKSTDPPPWEPEEPHLTRYIVNDITIEALADRLYRQYDGVLVRRDELAGWFGGIAEYKGGQGSDLGHWLASWSAAPLAVDRKTGAIKTVHVPRAAVNIIGGIQPSVLRAAIGREHMQDGLCARLLLADHLP
jgi:Protein of unknown function (DUF3987)